MERDKLRLSLDREVAASKRLSLENEELAWRLNTYQNSPTSPSFEKINWRMQSGFSSPDSAVFSQRIEESEHESHMDETKVPDTTLYFTGSFEHDNNDDVKLFEDYYTVLVVY